jgi:hypothetical protein
VHYLSPEKKIVIAAVPAAVGLLAACLTYLVAAELPLLLLVYFLVCAAASQGMAVLWGNAVLRRIAEIGDRPDGPAQLLMLASRRQHETVIWYAKWAGVCAAAWGLLLVTR